MNQKKYVQQKNKSEKVSLTNGDLIFGTKRYSQKFLY